MLTPRQHEALDVICRRVAAGQGAPSFTELGGAIGAKSRGDMSRLVHGLEARGFLKTVWGKQRSITPLKWPDGSAFDPNTEARTRELCIAYEDGRHAARMGIPESSCKRKGQHAVAWKIGYDAEKAGK